MNEALISAYMVVSRLPKLNGTNQSCEVATLALDILRNVERFTIPHLPNEFLLIRTGIRTGKYEGLSLVGFYISYEGKKLCFFSYEV